MAIGVVHSFETVEIKRYDRHGSTGLGTKPAELVIHALPIENAGQAVVHGKMTALLLCEKRIEHGIMESANDLVGTQQKRWRQQDNNGEHRFFGQNCASDER